MEVSLKSRASSASQNPEMLALFMAKQAIKYVTLDAQQDWKRKRRSVPFAAKRSNLLSKTISSG